MEDAPPAPHFSLLHLRVGPAEDVNAPGVPPGKVSLVLGRFPASAESISPQNTVQYGTDFTKICKMLPRLAHILQKFYTSMIKPYLLLYFVKCTLSPTEGSTKREGWGGCQ